MTSSGEGPIAQSSSARRDSSHDLSPPGDPQAELSDEQEPHAICVINNYLQIVPAAAEALLGDAKVDGQPPNGIPAGTAGSNLCQVSLAGGSIFTRGVLYVAGDLVYGGAGSAATIWAETPDQTHEQIQVNHAGLIYTDGIYDQSGQRFVYGSIIANGGFGTGGSPDVYYDYNLASGLPFSFNSEVSVARWSETSAEGISVLSQGG